MKPIVCTGKVNVKKIAQTDNSSLTAWIIGLIQPKKVCGVFALPMMILIPTPAEHAFSYMVTNTTVTATTAVKMKAILNTIRTTHANQFAFEFVQL